MLGNQSKWIGALVGYIVGAIVSGLATFGLASCGVEGDISTCVVLGMDAATVQNVIHAVITVASVWVFPANVKAKQ